MTSEAPTEGRAEVEGGATTSDRRVREAVVSGFAWTVLVTGLIWGAIYLGLGLPLAALYPFGFSVFTAVNILADRRHRRFRLFACLQIVAMLLTPQLLMVHLGGLAASGAVGIWSLMAPLGALLVVGERFATGVFAGFVLAVGAGLWADERMDAVETLLSGANGAHLLLNVLGVSLVAFWAMRIFLAVNDRLAVEQQRLRQVERSYVAQEAMLRQQDRLATLGKLSAGVAHELNNPAAAAGRATVQLGDVVDHLVDRAVTLLGLGVGPEGLSWLWSMAQSEPSTDPLEVSDREDGMREWFVARSVENPWELANALATLGFDQGTLNQGMERYNERQVLGAVQWIADVARARRLLGEVRTSAGRISEIVAALKGYSHMDGAVKAEVDVVRGIEDTLVILRSQLSGIEVERRFDEGLPKVVGNAGELNQVWTNLLANAVEALEGSGAITIEATQDADTVRLSVVDDGPGIPEHLLDSIFDPFVTTKAPGQGTGLGLNLTHQIVVGRHRGRIDVESRPGATRFTVTLPIDEASDV